MALASSASRSAKFRSITNNAISSPLPTRCGQPSQPGVGSARGDEAPPTAVTGQLSPAGGRAGWRRGSRLRSRRAAQRCRTRHRSRTPRSPPAAIGSPMATHQQRQHEPSSRPGVASIARNATVKTVSPVRTPRLWSTSSQAAAANSNGVLIVDHTSEETDAFSFGVTDGHRPCAEGGPAARRAGGRQAWRRGRASSSAVSARATTRPVELRARRSAMRACSAVAAAAKACRDAGSTPRSAASARRWSAAVGDRRRRARRSRLELDDATSSSSAVSAAPVAGTFCSPAHAERVARTGGSSRRARIGDRPAPARRRSDPGVEPPQAAVVAHPGRLVVDQRPATRPASSPGPIDPPSPRA